ncbi:hypothetical protein [Luteolibacter sp. AS25]|uniref:hypothetical protein n=1 Tax=Luteolibacter sp. AS25 TaxID=3135776 RepID=UPI00398B1AD7
MATAVIVLGISTEATAWLKLESLESYVRDYPAVFLGMSLCQLVVLSFISLVVVVTSNRKHRKQLDQLLTTKVIEDFSLDANSNDTEHNNKKPNKSEMATPRKPSD